MWNIYLFNVFIFPSPVLAGDPSSDPGGEWQGEGHLVHLGYGDQSAYQPAAATSRELSGGDQAAGYGGGLPGTRLWNLRKAYHAGTYVGYGPC